MCIDVRIDWVTNLPGFMKTGFSFLIFKSGSLSFGVCFHGFFQTSVGSALVLALHPLLAGYWSSLIKANLLLWLTLFCFFVARKVEPFWLAQCWPYAIIRPYQGTEVLDFQLAAFQPITRDGSRILLCLNDMKVHIVPFLCSPLSWSII